MADAHARDRREPKSAGRYLSGSSKPTVYGQIPVPASGRPCRWACDRGRLVIGTTIRAIGHRWRPVLAVPYGLPGRHMVIIGSSGSGKTTLMMRLWAGWFTTAWQRFRAGQAAWPLLAALDCKGGPDGLPGGRLLMPGMARTGTL